jgi:energy-coupling factor transporter ATP-binding protein EcfA2
MLSVENLEVRYGGITALHGVSIEVAEGETILLVGANGAGKSSLINAVIGLASASHVPRCRCSAAGPVCAAINIGCFPGGRGWASSVRAESHSAASLETLQIRTTLFASSTSGG